MAYDELTAVAETRPYVGAHVAVASCKTKRRLKILDLSDDHNNNEKTNNFRRLISQLFS